MKKLLVFISIFSFLSIHAQLNVGFSGAKGSYTFSKPFKTIKDIPRFSEWDSLPNGKWRQLYEGGQVAIEFTMKKYLLNGPAKGYYPDGALRYEFTMNGNYIDGEFKEYYPSGQLWRLYTYFEGFFTGPWYIYYEDGVKQAEGTHKEDKKVGKLYRWWPNGKMKEERTYVNDTANGLTVFWYENGVKMMEGNQFIQDNRVGKWDMWWDNGQKQMEAEYINGMQLVHNAWTRDGKAMVINGEGTYTLTTLAGFKMEEGLYTKSRQHGTWMYWDDKKPGADAKKIYYVNGKKTY